MLDQNQIKALFLSTLLATCAFSVFGNRGPSSSPISTAKPVYRESSHPLEPGPIWGSIRAPYPTNAHWTNLVLGSGNLTAAPIPFLTGAMPQGIVLGYPNVHCLEPACFAFPSDDMVVGASELNESSKHEVVDFDQLSLTMQWSPASQFLQRQVFSAKQAQEQVLELSSRLCESGDSNSNCQVIASCLNILANIRQGDDMPVCQCPPVGGQPPVAQPPVAQPPVAQPPVAQPPVAQPPVSVPQPPTGGGGSDDPNIVRGIIDGRLIAHTVYGSPYVTIKYGGLTPFIGNGKAVLIQFNDQSSEKSATGTRFTVSFNTGNRFIIYALDGPITFNWEATGLRASGPYRGVIRIAIAPTPAHDALLDKHITPYPIAGKIETSFSGNEARISFHWITEGEGSLDNLLMLTLPHHRDSMINAQFTSESWKSLKGPMVGTLGSTWTLVEPLTTISWDSPVPISPEYLESIRSAVLEEVSNNVPIPSDTYSFGKVASRYARLALIAQQIGESAARDQFVSKLKEILTPWYLQTNNNQLVYDTTWGGIISVNGRDDSGAEYGQGWYNDQHFHFGYFLYASSVLTHFDQSWGIQHRDAIDNLARNIANPSSSDKFYPVTRHKDWYVGHSWASGLFEFGDAKNQESTSESVNGYYGLYLWGLAIGDNHMKDWGRLLMQTEIRSSQKYWQMYPSDQSIYTSPFVEHTCIGIVWATKVDYATWFGLEVEYIHAIQMLPYTPITEELLPAKWIQVEFPLLRESLTRPDPVIQESWRGFVFMTQAIISKAEAWNNAQTLSAYDNGNSKANTLYFIATRP